MTVLSERAATRRPLPPEERETFVVFKHSILNGAVTVYGPFDDHDVATTWAREYARPSWSVRPVEPLEELEDER